MVVYDLAKGPHLLGAGETNFGKSNFIRAFIHAILPFAQVAVLDFKGLDFYYLRRHCLVIEDQKEALQLLQQTEKEYQRRKKILRAAGVEKIQLYCGKEPLPYLVIVIDEFAEIQLSGIVECIDTLVRLARAVGIHLVAATQRPGCDVIPGRTRSQFPMRICFPVVDGVDSRMILGEQFSQAARLPAIPGRALFRHGIELVEVQTMNLPMKTAKLMLREPKREEWGFEQQSKRLLPR
jgi:S-DNA-T family DNA segregation ATPase FtsK/SpoIIIE